MMVDREDQEDLGEIKSIDLDNWDKAEEAGFIWFRNLYVTFDVSRDGIIVKYPEADRIQQDYIAHLKIQYGEENVILGNAFDQESETPEGIPNRFGLYVRNVETSQEEAAT